MLPPESMPIGGVAAPGVLTSNSAMMRSGALFHGAAVEPEAVGERLAADRFQRDVLGHAAGRDRALVQPVVGHIADAESGRRRDAAVGDVRCHRT